MYIDIYICKYLCACKNVFFHWSRLPASSISPVCHVSWCVSEAVDAAGLDASSLHACIADVAQEMGGWAGATMEPRQYALSHVSCEDVVSSYLILS